MRLFKLACKILPIKIAYAHCDIPCGIYDPTPLQIAAHTIIRMTQLLIDVGKEEDSTKREHDVARITHVKEEHGAKVEEELQTLRNDYFKDEHYASNPTLKVLFEDASKLSVKVRQTIDIDASKELLEKTLQIAEIFYKTKNATPVRNKSLFPTEGEMVTYSI